MRSLVFGTRREIVRTVRFLALLLLSIVTLAAAPALAQTSTPQPPPDTKAKSPGGVDMVSGQYREETTDLTIGDPAMGGLTFQRVKADGDGLRSNWHYFIKISPVKKINDNGIVTSAPERYLSVMNSSIGKTWESPDWGFSSSPFFVETGARAEGYSTLIRNGSGSNRYFAYTATDGTVTTFQTTSDGTNAYATQIARPDGVVYTLTYDTGGVRV